MLRSPAVLIPSSALCCFIAGAADLFGVGFDFVVFADVAGLLPRRSFPTTDVTEAGVNASAVNKIKAASAARPAREIKRWRNLPIKAELITFRESLGSMG